MSDYVADAFRYVAGPRGGRNLEAYRARFHRENDFKARSAVGELAELIRTTQVTPFIPLHKPKESDLVSKVIEISKKRRGWMKLIEVLEKLPIGGRVVHRQMGEGVTGVVTHKTEKDFVLELSNGRALVEPMDTTDASWSVHLSKKTKKLYAYLVEVGEPGYSYHEMHWLSAPRPIDAENASSYFRQEESDKEMEVYE